MNLKFIALPIVLMLLSTTVLVIHGGLIGTVSAASSGDFTYQSIEGGTTVEITGYSGSGGDVEIPSTIDGLPVTMIGEGAFYYHSGVTSVHDPDGRCIHR